MTFKSLFKAGLLATASLIASAVPASADPISIALLTTVGFSQAAIGGTLLAATTAGLQVLAGTALSVGLNLLSTALSEKPRGVGGSRTQVQIGADVPRQIMFGRGATAGSPVYISGKGKKNKYLTIIFRLSDWECDSLESVWIEGDKRTLTPVSVVGTEHSRFIVSDTNSKIVVKFFRGTMAQAADSELIADEAGTEGTRIGTWTANHRLAGICYASVRVEYGEENMPSVPSFVFGLKGAKLYDWRKDSTNGGSGAHRWADPTTWEWSDNPAVCDYNFRRGFYRNGIRVLGMGVPAADLLTDYYTSAANICDETLTEGGVSEKRYTVGVLVPDDAEWRVAVDAFRAAMAGEVIERAGSFGIIAGGAYAPSMTLTDDDMRADAPCSFSRKVPRSELYNAVSVSWANPRIRYESDTLTPLTDATYEADDNSERIVKDVDLSMVYKPYQARRIGKIILEQSRMQAVHVGVYPARFSALEPGDWVTRTFNRDGLGSVTMKVVSIREVEPEWYEITLRQAASGNFVAPSGTITVADPPIVVQTSLLPGTPASLTLAETVNINADGAILSTLTATWAAAENASSYTVAVKQGATEIEYGTGSALTYSFRAVIGVAYQVRVRAVDGDGVKGAWTSYASLTPSGDTTPPGPPSALTATGLFSSVLLSWTNPTDKDFAATEVWEATSNSFSTASKVATVSNTMWSRDGLAPTVTRYYWLKAVDRTGNVSAKHPTSDTGGVSATTLALGSADFPANLKPIEIVSALPSTGNYQGRTVFLTTDNKLYRYNGSAFVATVPTADLTGQVSAAQIADAAITTAKFAAGIEPIEILAALPSTGNFQGRTVFLTTDNKLYRYNGTSFVSTVPASDLTGQVTATQIEDAAITTAKFAAGIKPIEILAALPSTGNFQGRTVFLTTDNKLYRYNGTAFVSTVPASDLTGQVTTAQIADAAISTAKFAAGIEPIEILGSLPATGNFQGRTVFLTTDNKLYRYNGTTFVSSVPAGDLTGQITSTQITDDAITTAKLAANAVTADELAANSVVAGKVAAAAISTAELAAGAVTAAKIAAGTITATEIAAATITGAKIAADTITAANIASSAITTDELAANSVAAGKIAAAAVSTAELAAGAVTAAKIAAGTITANEIAASTITGAKIAADTITAANIAANAITASELSAASVTAGKIAAAAVSTTELAAGAVTAAKIAAGTITANEIAANTISGTNIAADTITAGNIAANAITSSELSANSVVAGKIAAAAVTATELAANAVTAAKILAGTITADKLSVATLSAISANVGTVTAGLIRSGTSGMEIDLTNNRMRSGGFSSTALTGFELDGTTGTLTANSVTIAGGTSSRRPFELAFGAVQDGILTDEATANLYLPAALTGATFGSVYGSVRRTATETIYNLKVEVADTAGAVGAGYLQGGFPRAYGIACAPASLLVWSKTPGSYFQNGFLVVTKTGEVRFVVSGTDAVVNVNTQSRVLGRLYNEPDADPLFLNSYAQTDVHVWKSVLTGGIRRIRVPDTVTVSGTPTPVAGMRVWMWGAAGQWGSGLRGGPGGYVKFDHSVSPGEMLSLLVGAYNGDGFGGMSPNYVDNSATRATKENLINQGGGGSFLWRGPTRRANLMGVAAGGGSGGKLRIGGSGGSTTFGGGNGETGSEMNVCLGLTSLGDDEYAFGSGGFYANYGASSGGGGYVGGGRLGAANPNNEGGKGGTNYVISTATSVTNSFSAQDANGASTVLTPPGTSESVYAANSAYSWGRANAGTAATTQGDAGPGLIAIQWLT